MNMLERAAKASREKFVEVRAERLRELLKRVHGSDEEFMSALDPSREQESRMVAQAALLAALDPEDEELREAVMVNIACGEIVARAVIEGLRAYATAQGETND